MTATPKRRAGTASHKTSALQALRASGLVGLFSGAPHLATNRKRILKDKLRGKAGTAR